MQSVEMDGVDRILEGWDRLLQEFPDKKRELLEELGQKLLGDVRRSIGGTGTVQGWQERYTGSKLGYVAVRPRAKTYQATKGGKKYAVGYVTNAIENGHRHRKPAPTGRKGYRYRPRNTQPAAYGKHFYAQVRGRLSGFGQGELQRLAEELARRLEGET